MSIAELEGRELLLDAPSGGLFSEAWSRLLKNPGAIVGFILVGIFVFLALFAPFIAPEDPRVGRPVAAGGQLLSRALGASIGSESTSRAGTSSRESCTAPASRC